MTKFIRAGEPYIWLPYTQMQLQTPQLPVDSTQGVRIHLKDGRSLIDGISSWWSVAHGYNHPHIAKAIKRQINKLPHIMLAGLANDQTYRLAYNLSKITPPGLNKVFFSDSGSTAVEVGVKMAIQYFLNQNQSEKNKIISFKNSYHGDTFLCMALADLESGMHSKFKNCLNRHFNIPLPRNENELNHFEDFLKKNHQSCAAVIIEPLVQCAGGMKFHSPEILRGIYEISKKYNLLFIADECATGFWRTGEYFACNHAKISPDIMILGKALTGGFVGLAATLATDEIFNKFLSDHLDKALMHGPTFTGNPLACSAANASIELFAKNNYRKKVDRISNLLKKELEICRNFSGVTDVRVLGAICVIETEWNYQKMFALRQEFVKKMIWLRPFGNIIYVMPPLIIENSDLLKITNAVKEVLS